jgi:hypothetical protein
MSKGGDMKSTKIIGVVLLSVFLRGAERARRDIDIKKYILVLIFFLLTACASPMVGKTLPPRNYPSFDNMETGHHRSGGEQVIVDYDWTINSEKQTITLKGFYEFTSGEWKAFLETPEYKEGSLTAEVVFMDSEYTVIHVGKIPAFINPSTRDSKISFNKTFKYSSNYKYVVFTFKGGGYHHI